MGLEQTHELACHPGIALEDAFARLPHDLPHARNHRFQRLPSGLQQHLAKGPSGALDAAAHFVRKASRLCHHAPSGGQ